MARITVDELQKEDLLSDKLQTNQMEIEEAMKELNEVYQSQAKLFERKINQFIPIMKFIRSKKYSFSNPQLTQLSKKGAVLDYDHSKDNLYVYDVENGHIKRINMTTEKTKPVDYLEFVEKCNLENAISGLNYLLVLQDEVKKDILEEKEKREQWIKENE